LLTITLSLSLGVRLLLIPSTESSFINQLGQFLLDEFVNFGNGSIQTCLAGAGNMKI
jgi:hypothetical protein